MSIRNQYRQTGSLALDANANSCTERRTSQLLRFGLFVGLHSLPKGWVPVDMRSGRLPPPGGHGHGPAVAIDNGNGADMAKVAREMVEKAGVDVDQLVELLVKNAGAELTTYYYYTILRTNLIGLQGETVKEIAEVARVEDRNHFEALVPRIYELGGKLPDDMKTFHDLSACKPARLPDDPRDIHAMLTVLVEAERCAVRGYTNICNITAGKDHRTYDLSLSILNEEIEHESWFSEFLGEGPSGHFMRRGETSPFVSKFLR